MSEKPAAAHGLNADRVPAPRGAVWLASTLNGNASRGHGILVNPIYAGNIVWNRIRMIKDPDTGKRVSRVNDSAEWVTTAAPHLAIVSTELFVAVQERKAALSHVPATRRRKAKHLFSGLLKCGCCGGGLSVKDRDHGRVRLVCTRSREGGACTNRRHFYLDEIEARISRGLRKQLGSRAALDRYVRVYTDERRRLIGDRAGVLDKLQRRLAAIDANLGRATDYMIRGLLEEVKGAAQIQELKAERAVLVAEREAIDDAVPDLTIHPAIADAYLEALGNLEAALKGPEGPYETDEFSAVRDLVDSIVVTPDPTSSSPNVELNGDLARFLAPAGYSSGGKVVAEEGFEPPTRGL